MNVLTDAIKIALAAIFLVFITPVILVIAAYVGYFFGLIVAFLAGGVLTGVLPISTGAIPYIFAWIFVLGSVVSIRKGSGKSE